MAQILNTTAGTLIVPGGYSTVTVQSNPAGLSTTGVIMLVGEADGGPDYSLEDDLSTGFGVDQGSDIRAKYISGPLVDAYLSAVQAANDPEITGSPSKIILVKTNPSTKASGLLPKIGGGNYGTLYDKGYGKLGNLTYFKNSLATAETIPTTGNFTWLPNIASLDTSFRVNGGLSLGGPLTLGALTLPPAFQTAVDAVAGITCTGGTDRAILVGGDIATNSLSVTINGANSITITKTGGTWGTTPSVGDTVFIPTGSIIQGGTNTNRGSYVVTGATTTTITCTKLRDETGSPGALTSPIDTVGSTLITATTNVRAFASVVISIDPGLVIDGVGKTLEVNELTSLTDRLSNYAYQLNTTQVTWISKLTSAKVLASSSEYSVSLAINRQFDGVSETAVAGGEIGLKVGYTGTSATLTISDTVLTTTVVGGSGSNLTLSLKDFPTISDLATYIAAQTGYTAAVGTNVLGQLSPVNLDNVTNMGLGTTFGAQTGRLKIDAYKFFTAISENSGLVQLSDPAAQVGAGLPDVMTVNVFLGSLSLGTRGATTDAGFQLAVDALEAVRGNFLVPLFSRNANGGDITDGLTDSGSTYTIDGINSYCKTHVLKMSTLKKRRNRQAFCSKRDTFANAREAAGGLASFRVAMTFQDVKNSSSNGGITQFQPWMGAVLAAGMQAAGGYKGIVFKGINCSGVLQAARDYNDQLNTNEENALLAGLLPARRVPVEDGGGIIWISDQTTYGKDSNFVYNSIQATYVADIVALSAASRMERVFVGQSLADVSAAQAVTVFESIMSDFMRLKFIARSDDAVKGFKNLTIKISGPAMLVSVEIKLATLIYFVKIDFLVSQVTQTATGG